MLLQPASKTLLCRLWNLHYISRRCRFKWNKHSSRLKKDPTQLALEHFDTYYEPVFNDKWPSVRLALLSQQKYCALVNNFADSSETVANLVSDGADNIMKIAEQTEPTPSPKRLQKQKSQVTEQASPPSRQADVNDERGEAGTNVDLYTFMPTKRMGSEIEQMKDEERAMNIPTDIEVNAKIIPDAPLHFPRYLKAYAYERGNPSLFRSPKRDSTQKTDYYLFDAASILPVLALDLLPECQVLDLCAAPGGKTLTMLQTHLTGPHLMKDGDSSEEVYTMAQNGQITCVDNSHTRLQRLSEIMAQYIPSKRAVGQLVKIICSDGISFCKKISKDPPYDRVLVDVPCNNDRHVLEETENNLFKPSRLKERLQIPKIQRDLLYHGILACKPKGNIVYSTCTLSPVQNDGVIQATLERIWTDTRIEVAVVDISQIANRFRKIYNFADNTRYGQLVLPSVTANFGPMYICKLKRIN